MTFKNNPYLNTYMEMAGMQESCDLFNIWGGIFTLSAALERRCYTQWLDLVWPNQWICLVGEAASRKGTSMRKAGDVLRRCNIWFGPEVTSIQKFTSNFADPFLLQSYQNPENGVIEFHSSVAIMAEELTTFTKVRDPEHVQTLCRLYDNPDNFDVQTHKRGLEKAKRICINMLCGTTPDALRRHMPDEMLTGGFGSRVMFVYGERPKVLKNGPLDKKLERRLQRYLVEWLRAVTRLSGGFIISDEAFDMYCKWRDVSNLIEPPPIYYIPNLSYYIGRREMHLRKIMMAVSVGRSLDLVLTKEDFELALGILTMTENVMPRALGAVAPRSNEEMFGCLATRISMESPNAYKRDATGLAFRDMMKLCAGYWSRKQLEEVLNYMIECRFAKRITVGGETRYVQGAEMPADWRL